MKCLITGAQVHDPAHNLWAVCDVYQVGTALVFNCNVDGDGQTQWFHQPTFYAKVATVTGNFFESRGVIVQDSSQVVFNEAALDYMAGEYQRG